MRQHGEEEKEASELSPRDMLRERIAKRAALEFKDGMYGILFTMLYKGYSWNQPPFETTSL